MTAPQVKKKKDTMTQFIIYIYFNRTIHVIKYLHAENGNRTEWHDRCGHNFQNRLCPVIKGRCHQ